MRMPMTAMECPDVDAFESANKSIPNLPWFVAQVKPGGFTKAKLNLARQGYKTFMPHVERTVRHARSERVVLRPLFPGYIFIAFNPEITQWRAINNTFGVLNLIMGRENSPAPVPEVLMAPLFAGCDHSDKILPPAALSAGDNVRVVRGAFQGVLAQVQQASDGERVRILLEIMGRPVVTDCASNELEVLGT